ncbi:DUF3572 domain-containing protein [Bosea sp. CER48]|uniref:DUF3572 domain-containing protein n=1 Tax=Bosea sp. CER48 TaxID=3377035 RepID=UPI003814A69B
MAPRLTIEDAETLALRALAFLAAEPERIEPFLSATGLNPANLRSAAGEPGFLGAVLDHIAGSDSLLLEFAENLRLNPEIVASARHVLAGPEPDDFS